jgi:SAM-dependent methyltransferase
MLAKLGFDAVAFDISATAIRKARERFPLSGVDYCVGDLLNAPLGWKQRFAFVLEAYTLQVLPPVLQGPAMNCIADFVAPGGTLLVICRGRDENQPRESRVPWPLSRKDLVGFSERHLKEISFEDYFDAEDPPVRRFRVVFRSVTPLGAIASLSATHVNETERLLAGEWRKIGDLVVLQPPLQHDDVRHRYEVVRCLVVPLLGHT